MEDLASSQFWQSSWQIVSHNWALFSILLTILVLLFVPALILAKYVRICLNILRDTVPPFTRTQLGFQPILGEDKDFYARDGIRLRGVLLRPTTQERRGLVIFAPEFKSDRNSCARYCQALLAAGYDVFSFDFRGHGESAAEQGYSPLQWASDREVADVQGAIRFAEHWLEDQGRPPELGLFGISRGASAAVVAAAECPSVKAIITDGAFSSDCTLEHLMKKWASIFAKVRLVYENHPPEFWRFLRWCVFLTIRRKLGCSYPSVRKALQRMLPRPMLLIHGERDGFIPVDQSRLLYAMAAQPKHLWIVRGAKHNQSVDFRPREYARRTVEFFDRYLAKRDDPQNMFNEGRFEDVVQRVAAHWREPTSAVAEPRAVHDRMPGRRQRTTPADAASRN